MSGKTLAVFAAVAFFGALILAVSTYQLFGGKGDLPPSVASYNGLLFASNSNARTLYGYNCGEGLEMLEIFGGVDNSEADEKVSAELCQQHRAKQIEKWEEIIKTSDDRAILARALFYKGQLQYANAYDYNLIESARLGVQALEASLAHEPTLLKDGFSEFDTYRIALVEMARVKLAELEKKEEEKKEREQKSQQSVSIPVSASPKDSNSQEARVGEESDLKGKIDAEEIPVVEEGTKP